MIRRWTTTLAGAVTLMPASCPTTADASARHEPPQTWGGPDCRRTYLRWRMNHLPTACGWNTDGRLNDRWAYVYDYAHHDAQGPAAPMRTIAPGDRVDPGAPW